MKTTEIANILQAEVNNELNNGRYIVTARTYIEPSCEEREMCEKYGFTVIKTNEHKCGTLREVWLIEHQDPSEVEVASVETYLDAAIHTDRATYESVVKALGRFLGCEDSIELALNVRDMGHEYMAYPSDEPKSENYYELLIAKHASIIKEIYGKN